MKGGRRMIQMTHFYDGKDKRQSHEISFVLSGKDADMNFDDSSVTDLSIRSVVAYGETKEEALKNLKPIMQRLFEVYREIEKLYDDGFYEENMIEVDCFGKKVEE